MTDTIPNTPANGGQILTDERIINLAYEVDTTRAHELHGDTLTIFKDTELFQFARLIEADLRASLAAPAIQTDKSTPVTLDSALQALAHLVKSNTHADQLEAMAMLKSAAPAIPTVDRNAVAEEGAEILGSLIESIEKHGNYSAEATVTFLSQAKQCFDEIKSAAHASVPQPTSATVEGLKKLVQAYSPKSLQYDIEHANDGLNSSDPAEVLRVQRGSTTAQPAAQVAVSEDAVSAVINLMDLRGYFRGVPHKQLRIFSMELRDVLAGVPQPAALTVNQMVDRFLGWPVPKTFGPDCGITFDGRKDDEWNKNKTWPIGTNLLTAVEAKAMFEYVLATPATVKTAETK